MIPHKHKLLSGDKKTGQWLKYVMAPISYVLEHWKVMLVVAVLAAIVVGVVM